MPFYREAEPGSLERRTRLLCARFNDRLILCSLTPPPYTSTHPPSLLTQVEEFSKHNLNFTILDMSGESRYRNLWETYYENVQAIIFVVDSTDKVRMCVARDELDELLNHDHVKDRTCPILFFANKMDVPGACTPVDTMKSMGLERITNKAWHITSSNAITGLGVDEGVEWLAEKLIERQDNGEESKHHK